MLFSVSSYLWFLFGFFFYCVYVSTHFSNHSWVSFEGFTESYNSAFVVGEGKGNW